jgi:hypothetical protein
MPAKKKEPKEMLLRIVRVAELLAKSEVSPPKKKQIKR